VVSMAAAALACGVGSVAAKAPPAVRLTYERSPAAADCPDKETVLDAVRARLGFDPFREPAEIAIRASVTRTADELTADLRLSDDRSEGGEKRLVSRRADCSELASAMELALSIAIDPLSVTGVAPAPASPPAPSRPITVFVETLAPAPLPSSSPPGPAGPPKFLLALGGAVGSVGTSLSPTLGFLGGFGLASERWSVSLEGRADLPASREVEGGHITLSMLSGTLVPCLHRRPFSGCLLASFLALRGSGYDLDDARQLTTTLLALGSRVALELPSTGAFAVRAHADVLAPLARTTLKVGGQPVWTSPPVSVTLGVAAVVNFR